MQVETRRKSLLTRATIMARSWHYLHVILFSLSASIALTSPLASFSWKTLVKNAYATGMQTTQNYLLPSSRDKELLALASLDTADFIRHYGYPCETHDVVTKDDYVLTVHRIPDGRQPNDTDITSNCSKPVVFLQHGLFSYAGDWVLSGPEKALGFLLADAGYDVWLGNARGNKHSRDHLTLDPNVDAAFWNFSWHEIGYHDLPAMIDHVLELTQQERLFYVGHSQGTTVSYVALSERPEYNERIIAQYSLSPIAFVTHLFGPAYRLLVYFMRFIEFSMDLLQIYELKHENTISRYGKFCATQFGQDLCLRELFSFVGHDPKQFNLTLLPVILANYPAGSSTKQVKHFAQGVNNGNFAQFDYGYQGNMQVYGDPFPPSYNLENIKAPIYLFCSGNDYLSSLKDVKRLYWSLPDGKKYLWKVADDMWNHVDYVWGIQAKQLVYDKLMDSMKTYVNRDNYCTI